MFLLLALWLIGTSTAAGRVLLLLTRRWRRRWRHERALRISPAGCATRGVIAADAATPPEEHNDRPWFIALLQGVAGWLAGIFLLAFLGLVFKPENALPSDRLGVLLLLAAWVMYHADRDAVFLDQFALALSIAGQFAVAWAVDQG